MAIKEKLTQVITQMSGDNADALKTLLREAIAEFDTVNETLTQANSESKGRKEKIRELEKQIADKDEQIEKFNKLNPELEELRGVKAKYDAKIKQEYDTRLADWSEKAKVFGIPETDKRFAKVQTIKADFVFPADDKSQLTQEQLESNLKLFGAYEKANYFAEDGKPDTTVPRPGGNNPSTSANPYTSKVIKGVN